MSLSSRFSALLFVLLTAPLATHAQGGPPSGDYPGCGYISGADLEKANEGLIGFENGFFTNVPLDYSDPSKGTTRVYAYFAKKYDPAKPTFALFLGGPGQSAHQQLNGKFDLYTGLNYNFLVFDQRGISLSRFHNKDLAKDIRNYGSETTARDLQEILNKVGIKKVSIYGTSYGTIPATIFGSLFPDRTTSVFLEGVVYDGWAGIMARNDREILIQKYFDSFAGDLKTRLLKLVEEKKLPEYWFPMMVSAIMMSHGDTQLPFFERVLRKAFIEQNSSDENGFNLAWSEEAEKVLAGKDASGPAIARPTAADKCHQLTDSDDVNRLLMIKEFGAGEPNVSSLMVLRKGQVIRLPGSNYSSFKNDFDHWPESLSLYSANKYPIAVPTFYFQGAYDSATPARGAIEHFKEVPQANAQLILFKRGGHMPTNLILFGMQRPTDESELLQKTISSVLSGAGLSCDAGSEFSKTYKYADVSIYGKGQLSSCP